MLHGAKNTATTMISIMNCSFLCNFIHCFFVGFVFSACFFLAFFFGFFSGRVFPSPSPRGFNLDKQTSHKKCFNINEKGAHSKLLLLFLLLLYLKTSCVVHLARHAPKLPPSLAPLLAALPGDSSIRFAPFNGIQFNSYRAANYCY